AMRERQSEAEQITFESAADLSEHILNRPRSQRTLIEYGRAIRLLDEHGLTPQQVRRQAVESGKPLSESRYRTLKGAYQFKLAGLISAAVRETLSFRTQDDPDSTAASCAQAIELGRELARQKPDYERNRYRDNSGPAHPAPPTNRKPVKRSKRRYIGKLNRTVPDWRDLIFDALPQQHRMAVALLNLTGCRPAELEKPVLIRALDDGRLEVTLHGSKLSAVSGQEQRTMIFNPGKSKWANGILGTVTNSGEAETTFCLSTSGRSLRYAHSRAVSRALGAKWQGKVSLYSYRHSFSADLKAKGFDRDEIAMAMGHNSDRSQTSYGLANQSVGCDCALDEVTASREVKRSVAVTEYISTNRDFEI
ncbi:MAG: tyrosine-type recombinase/integrase, partial [Pseudomonadota bacterium]